MNFSITLFLFTNEPKYMLLSTDKLDFYKKEFMSYIMTHEAYSKIFLLTNIY